MGLPTGQGLRRGTRIWFHRRTQPRQLGIGQFRRLALNAIAWIAKVDVPDGGVRPGEVTVDDLQANQDYSPRGWEPEKIKSKLKEFNGKIPKKGASHDPRKSSDGSGTKPLFSSKIVTARTPGQGIDVIAEIKGLDELHLYVSDAGNGYACDWANWVNPTLVDASGKATKLTSLKWKDASSGWGGVNLNKNASGGAMKVAGKKVQGIGCHANSLISYQLPANHKFTRFLATGALDDGGTSQGACGNQYVQFPRLFEKTQGSRGR